MNAVASRVHTQAGASCFAFQRQNFAWGKVFRTHGVLTQSQTTDTKKAPQGVLSFVWRWARDYPKPPYDVFGPMGFAALRLGSQTSQGRFGSNPLDF